jgi:transposase
MEILTLNKIDGHEKEIEELRCALKETKNVRMHKRYAVILRHFEGFTNKRIAEMEGLEPHAVGTYIKNYNKSGLSGLEMKFSPGAKRKLNTEQQNQLVEVIINKTPDEVGFEGRKNWTIELIRQWAINQFDIELCHSAMSIVLRRLNLSYTRPTYVLAKADKEKQEDFKKDFEVLKKTP